MSNSGKNGIVLLYDNISRFNCLKKYLKELKYKVNEKKLNSIFSNKPILNGCNIFFMSIEENIIFRIDLINLIQNLKKNKNTTIIGIPSNSGMYLQKIIKTLEIEYLQIKPFLKTELDHILNSD